MSTLVLQLVFATLTLASGIRLAMERHLVRALYLLFALLFSVAALFVTAGQTFAAVVQLVLYVGGILILMVFGVLLSRKSRNADPQSKVRNPIQALLLALTTAAALFGMVYTRQDVLSAGSGSTGLRNIGDAILSRMAVPFELVTILLLVALVGASAIVRTEKEDAG